MSNCEWMFGDAARGLLGFNELASLNPLRWSGALSFDKGIADLEASLKTNDRPIVVKVPAGISTKEKRFETTQEAIDYLKSVDPKRMSLKQAAETARAAVAGKEQILAESKDAERMANDALNQALEASGKAKSKTAEWMFGDAGKGLGSLGMVAARMNPVRWSGSQTFSKTIEELAELVKLYEEKGESQRPITLKIPPGFASPEQKFETCQAAIDHLKKDVEGEGDQALDVLENAHERAKECLEDAEKQLKDAVAAAEAAEVAAAAAA